MKFLACHFKFAVTALLLLSSAVLFSACSGKDAATEKSFVGKWKSSKLETPVYLYENGDWEIKKDDGAVLQFGVWEYKNKNITWSYKINSYIGHDTNPVLSANSEEFQVRESDGTTTTFSKLE